FKRNVRVGGLKSVEYELLIAALIAADLEEDKRYARSLFSGERLAVDGFFNFTMKALKDKWRDVVGYVPAYFAPDQLKDFILYVAGEKKGGRLRVVGGRVYDEAYNLLSRAYLTGGGDCKVVKEVIISSPVEVLLTRPVPEKDEYYLKQFFGDKIVFDGNDKIYGH
ncbi:MAG: hypothetical protein ILP02_03045, partial [Clostridia bacterium]|nr:hypothetical protein [Clostridia bacterium]